MTTQTSWRIIFDPPAAGAWNMAVDESILESCILQKSLPTLRLYSWQPACLSIGFAQPISDVDLTALKKYGWQIVRRPTGGRAILHVDELTYSVCGLTSEPALSGSLLESYQHISAALQKALRILGVSTSADEKYKQPDFSQGKGPVCFEVPSNYEITANKKKLIGSAQARRKNALLQHGSLPLEGDLTRITWVLSFSDEQSRESAAKRVIQRAVSLETIMGKPIPVEDATRAFMDAFAEQFSINFIQSNLSVDEIQTANYLFETKYNHSQWTERI